MIVCCCHGKTREKIIACRRSDNSKIGPITKNESQISAKHSQSPENAPNDISDTYEEYGENNSYEVYKSDNSYEAYVEKYQDYGHFQKFQRSKTSNESSETSSKSS